MRKTLIDFSLFAAIFSSFIVAWALGFNKPEPTAHLEQLRAVLRTFEPTAEELNAVSQLRKNAVAIPPQTYENVADSDIDDIPQISVECRFLTFDESLFKMILETPEMQWSCLPANLTGVSSNQNSTNMDLSLNEGFACWNKFIPVPVFVRFLDASHSLEFLKITQNNSSANILQAPKVTMLPNQPGYVCDVTREPFMISVASVEDKRKNVIFRPLNQTFDTGVKLQFQMSLLENDSCRFEQCGLVFSSVHKVKEYEIFDKDAVDVNMFGEKTPEDQKGNNILIRIPLVHHFKASLQNVTIPKNMSLLAVFPGVELGAEIQKPVAIILTPRIYYPDPEAREVGDSNQYGYCIR